MALTSNIISPRKLRYDLILIPGRFKYPFCHLCSCIHYRKNIVYVVDNPILPETRVFDCNETPDMTIQSYLERIFRYTRAGPSVYVVAYVYIDRFCQLYPQFRIGPRNVQRLLIATIMLASKYVQDLNYRNSYFA